jgi:hypothetical protein
MQKLELKPRIKSYLFLILFAGLGGCIAYFSSIFVKDECSGRRKAFCELMNNFDSATQEMLWIGLGGIILVYCLFVLFRISRLKRLATLSLEGLDLGWTADGPIGWNEISTLSVNRGGLTVEFHRPRETVSFMGFRKDRQKLNVPLLLSRAYVDEKYQWGGAKRAIKRWLSNLKEAQRAALSPV